MYSDFYGPDDSFGIPGNVLRLSDEFYGALGRVAALGALIELRLSDVVVLWGREPSDAGKLTRHLTDRFKQIRKDRLAAGYEMPDGLVQAVDSAAAVMSERNELLHSLWPAEDSGWRNRPGGTVATQYLGTDEVRPVIGRLVKAVADLGPYLRSPID